MPFLVTGYYSILWLDHTLVLHSSDEGLLGPFHLGTSPLMLCSLYPRYACIFYFLQMQHYCPSPSTLIPALHLDGPSASLHLVHAHPSFVPRQSGPFCHLPTLGFPQALTDSTEQICLFYFVKLMMVLVKHPVSLRLPYDLLLDCEFHCNTRGSVGRDRARLSD